MRDTSAFGIGAIFAVAIFLLALFGCSHDYAEVVVINPPQQADSSSKSGINIPPPGEILRNATALTPVRYRNGADYQNLLPNSSVAKIETLGLFSPNWEPGDPSNDLAYAIYGFNVSEYTGPAELHYAFDSINWGNIWLGLPDIAADVWRWQNLDGESPLDLVEFSNKVNGLGHMFVAVVVTGTTPTQLEWLRVGTDTAPEAALVADATVGEGPLTVNFDASGSRDIEAPLVLYEWDWDGDGIYEEDSGTTPTNQHEYTGTGEFNPTVRVTDSADNQATATVPVFVIGGDPSWHITHIADVGINSNHALMNLNGKPAIAHVTDDETMQIVFTSSLDFYGVNWADPVEMGTGWLQEGELLIVDGKPAFAFIMQAGFGLYYSTVRFVSAEDSEGLAWNAPIDLATDVGNPYMAAAMIGGNPAVCYSSPNSGAGLYFLRATDPAGATWAAPALATTAVYPPYSILSMAEVNNNPAIVFFDDDEYLGYVRATNPVGSSWGPPLIRMNSGWLGFGLTLLVVDGNPAICYADDGTANMYMRSTDVNGTAWGTPVVVDDTGDVWNECYMAIVNGVPAISFTGGVWPYPQIYYCESDDAVGTTWTRNEPVSPVETEDWNGQLIDLNGMPAMTYFTDVVGTGVNQIFFAAYY